MERVWSVLAVVFYPIATILCLAAFPLPRFDRFNALASGFIVFLLLWLYALPRDLERLGELVWESRFTVPLTAYLCGLAVTALLMSWTVRPKRRDA